MTSGSIRSDGDFVSQTGVCNYPQFSIVYCVYFLDSPANGVFRTGAGERITSNGGTTDADGFLSYQFPPDDPTSPDDIVAEYKTGNLTIGATTHDDPLVSSSSVYGTWVHYGHTYDLTTGTQGLYIVKEGINPVSPAWLTPTNVAGNLSNASLYKTNLWIDSAAEGDVGQGMALGHWVLSPFVATQAQIVAQMMQRAPTSDFLAGGNCTYFSMTDPTTLPTPDIGPISAVYAKSGSSFTGLSTFPSDWGSTPSVVTPYGSRLRTNVRIGPNFRMGSK